MTSILVRIFVFIQLYQLSIVGTLFIYIPLGKVKNYKLEYLAKNYNKKTFILNVH